MSKAKYLKVVGVIEVIFVTIGFILFMVFWSIGKLPLGIAEGIISMISIILFGPLFAVILFSIAELLEKANQNAEQMDTVMALLMNEELKQSIYRKGDKCSITEICKDVDNKAEFDPGYEVVIVRPFIDYALCECIDEYGKKHLFKIDYKYLQRKN